MIHLIIKNTDYITIFEINYSEHLSNKYFWNICSFISRSMSQTKKVNISKSKLYLTSWTFRFY